MRTNAANLPVHDLARIARFMKDELLVDYTVWMGRIEASTYADGAVALTLPCGCSAAASPKGDGHLLRASYCQGSNRRVAYDYERRNMADVLMDGIRRLANTACGKIFDGLTPLVYCYPHDAHTICCPAEKREAGRAAARKAVSVRPMTARKAAARKAHRTTAQRQHDARTAQAAQYNNLVAMGQEV